MLIWDNNFKYIGSEFFILIYIVIAILIGILSKEVVKFQINSFRIQYYVCLLFLGLLFIIESNSNHVIIINDQFSYNYITYFCRLLLLMSAFSCVLLSKNYSNKYPYEYFIILNFALLGLYLLTAAADLLSLYLAIEMQSLAFYVLAALQVNKLRSVESSIKYFILGAVASGLLLLGMSLLYSLTGVSSYNNIILYILNDNCPTLGISLSLLLISLGFFFKLGAAPFHYWIPDIYEGVPTIITTIFMILPKIGLICAMIKFYILVFGNYFNMWFPLFIIIGIISIIVGTLGAISQINIKRALAYGGIVHVGFILLGFAVYTLIGLLSILFYLLIYVILNISFFSILLALQINNKREMVDIRQFKSLLYYEPTLTFYLGLNILSFAGIPPFAGFYIKLYILESLIEINLINVSVLIAVLSVVNAFYYVRIVQLMFFINMQKKYIYNYQQLSKNASWLIVSISLINIFFCTLPIYYVTEFIYFVVLNIIII